MEFYLGFRRNNRKKDIGAVPPPPVSVDLNNLGNATLIEAVKENKSTFIDEFYNLPEVAFPVLYIISRLKNAEIVLRRYADDSEVWRDTKLYGDEAILAANVHSVLERPNFYQDFKAFTEQYFLQRYLTGNTFTYAAGVLDANKRWRNIDQLHIIPTESVDVRTKLSYNYYLAKEWSDIIDHYVITGNGRETRLESDVVMFTRDVQDTRIDAEIKAKSRLSTQKMCIDTLKEVYAARYAIYAKRGPLGAIVSQKSDADGSVPLIESEKKTIREQLTKKYGTGKGKDLYAIVDQPVNFVKLGSSINELQPFTESIQDATQIAAIFNIKKELIPRDGNSTFSNQEEAEISVYDDMVKPEMAQYLENLTEFLGIKEEGYYLDAKWDNVEVLKKRQQSKSQADKLKLETELMKFNSGVSSMNDILTAMGEEPKADDLYGKTIFEMTIEERKKIGR